MINYDPLVFRVADFWEWNNRKELILSSKYQRRAVWSEKAKSYLLDTMLRGLPLPKIFMRYDVDLNTKKSIREIVDGQQRIRAILSYLEDGFSVMKVHNKKYGGKYFSELDEAIRKQIWEFKISVDLLKTDNETDILDIFARLNTYTVTLNKQELINSKYFGAFKQVVYSLGFSYKDFWVNHKILTDRQVSRMGEAELTSELIIQIIHGIDDRKNLEKYYKQYDDEFSAEDDVRNTFHEVIELILELYGESLGQSNFSKIPLFYTLFGVINKIHIQGMTKKSNLSKLKSALSEVDSILGMGAEEVSKEHFSFYDASTKHVTDYKARRIRHDFIYKFIYGRINHK